MMTRSLCPRRSWACCASCTLMESSFPKLKLRGKEHSNCTPWAQRTVDPKLSPRKLSFWTFYTADGEIYAREMTEAEYARAFGLTPDLISRVPTPFTTTGRCGCADL